MASSLCLSAWQSTRSSLAYLLSPFETKPMLSSGSCFTGLSLSHGADDFRISGGGMWDISTHFKHLETHQGIPIRCRWEKVLRDFLDDNRTRGSTIGGARAAMCGRRRPDGPYFVFPNSRGHSTLFLAQHISAAVAADCCDERPGYPALTIG